MMKMMVNIFCNPRLQLSNKRFDAMSTNNTFLLSAPDDKVTGTIIHLDLTVLVDRGTCGQTQAFPLIRGMCATGESRLT